MRKVDKGILELLIGNIKVTDGQTDRQTDMCKAICPLFFQWGHNNITLLEKLQSVSIIFDHMTCFFIDSL